MHGETKIANVVGEQAFSFLEIQISLQWMTVGTNTKIVEITENTCQQPIKKTGHTFFDDIKQQTAYDRNIVD